MPLQTPDVPEEFPAEGRLLGVDFGTRRVGLAVSTREQNISSPLEVYERKNPQIDARYFRELVQEERIVGLVVGLPMHVGGEEGQKAREAREYGAWLARTTGLPVSFWDERYTSAAADEFLINIDMSRKKRKRRLDMIAAQIILQGFLDRPR
jgi:putative holliday junction resolvase